MNATYKLSTQTFSDIFDGMSKNLKLKTFEFRSLKHHPPFVLQSCSVQFYAKLC